MERVLALDPGEKVGWARADVREDAAWDNLEHGITSLRPMALAIAERADNYDKFVVETFRLSANKMRSQIGSDFPTVQFIGMVRLVAWQHGIEVRMQGPSIKDTADKTAPEWLQAILANEPRSHDDAHNVDALRHLWFYTWKEHVASA